MNLTDEEKRYVLKRFWDSTPTMQADIVIAMTERISRLESALFTFVDEAEDYEVNRPRVVVARELLMRKV